MEFSKLSEDGVFDFNSPRVKISDISIARGNNPHKHSHIEHIFHTNDIEWEFIKENDIRRGSVRYYLIENEYYVEFSRTGLEQAGNHIRFETGTDEELITLICNELFRVLTNVQYLFIDVEDDGQITLSIDPNDEVEVVNQMSGTNVEYHEISQNKRNMYYDYFQVLVDTINRFNNIESVDEIKTVVSGHHTRIREIRRHYTDYYPEESNIGEIIPTLEDENWIFPDEENVSGELEVLLHRSHNYEIVITNDQIELIYNPEYSLDNDETLFTASYSDIEELRDHIENGFETVSRIVTEA